MILSVSRRTDIPAFFAEWFYNRIEDEFVYVRNPMNYNQISNIKLSPEVIECIVFWTKNPSTYFINNLNKLDDKGYKYYFLFTLTPYPQDIEPFLPPKRDVIETFLNLSKKVGKNRVIWRYDPILLTEKYTFEYHLEYFEYLAKILSPYTEKCIISFVDKYPKIKKRLEAHGIRELHTEEMIHISHAIQAIADRYSIKVESCCESVDLSQAGVSHGHCIDGDLINRITNKKYLFEKDKTQRQDCGCITSVDIGTYNTCSHNCVYCYANWVERNKNKCDPASPLLCSSVEASDNVSERVFKKCDLLDPGLLFNFDAT